VTPDEALPAMEDDAVTSEGRVRRAPEDRNGRTGQTRPELPVKKVLPAYQQVANQLRFLILEGQLAPGDRLPNEVELSAHFGVSRSTVREALRVLASRDLVETARGVAGGTFVAHINADKVRDYLETTLGLLTGAEAVSVAEMLEAREVVEVPAARLAATRATKDDIEALSRSVQQEKLGGARGVRFEEHRNFHQLLVHASGNGLLTLMNEPVFLVLRARFLRPGIPADFWETVDDEHSAILDCIVRGDGDGAADLMRTHLQRLRVVYDESLEWPAS
jgi:GntR family transcriptional repressor for pyruvate dehydrogenase complex